MKILIVDDDVINRKFLEAMLASYGEIDQAGDGEAALRLVEDSMKAGMPYSVIFLDIMMPKMDGQQVLTRIRDLEPNFKVAPGKGPTIVMVTALVSKENVLSAFSAGCEYYLVKPVQQKQLYDLMEEIQHEKVPFQA